ncbi:MAG: DUF6077 domain-containing protein [Lachnospiraceae bacterium]|jgi:hypothetical protein|nr:DUF6077 domain-containing protein [Lachnospiraceae bacterium]
MIVLQYLLQFMSLIVWLLVIPYSVGLLPARFMEGERRTPGVILLAGYMVFFAVFELVAIIVTLTTVYEGLARLLGIFTPLAIILAALGLGWELVRPVGEKVSLFPLKIPFKDQSWEERAVWLIFLIILAFQLFMALRYASFDGDDSYFVVQSLTAWQRGFLYRFEPYTGVSTLLKYRNALATFPIWIAAVAEKARIHPTILAHSILPLFLLPLTYLLYFQIGKSLFREKKEGLPMFMVLMAVLQMFGNVSIYTNETFLLTRTWQGKSFAANFVIPAVLWLFLRISEEGRENVFWVLLGILLWVAGIGSALVVFLGMILCGVLALWLAFQRKKLRVLFKTIAACVPGGAYILLYILLGG